MGYHTTAGKPGLVYKDEKCTQFVHILIQIYFKMLSSVTTKVSS